LAFLKCGLLDLNLTKKVTIIVGDNGTGKSALLEGIAALCGFSLLGGSRNHINYDTETALLSRYLRLSWKPKVTSGFFLRAETIFSFIQTIDAIAREDGGAIHQFYGGKSLAERSHGEAFLSLFQNRFGRQGLYLMDEPEAALSPARQLDFLRAIKEMDDGDQCQLIIATHSALVMAYPNAQLLALSDRGIHPIEFHQTKHFKIMRDFYLDPDSFMAGVLMEE
jgi:predicted ATPase